MNQHQPTTRAEIGSESGPRLATAHTEEGLEWGSRVGTAARTALGLEWG